MHRRVREVVKYIASHHREEVAAFLLITILIGVVWVGENNRADAATYTFLQNSWSGGLDANSTAAHATDRTGWVKYSSSTNINGAATLTLTTSTASTTQTDDGTTNTGFNLSGGAFASTSVSGSGGGAGVILQSTTTVTTSTINSSYNQNGGASIAIGSDGFARITMIDSSWNVRVVKCLNTSCTSSTTSPALGSVGGSYITSVSMVLGLDGYPRLTYYGGNYVRCLDDSCNTSTSTRVILQGYTPAGREIAVGSDGYARLVMGNGSGLFLYKCSNDNCSSYSSTTMVTGNNWYPEMVMGQDGFPRIVVATASGSAGSFRFVRCGNDSCSSASTTVISLSNSGLSLAMGQDGYARISYSTGGVLKYIQCLDANCSTRNVNTINGVTGNYTDIAIGQDGYARIMNVYGGSQYIQCLDDSCSSVNITSIDASALNNSTPAIAIGSDGFPRIAVYKSPGYIYGYPSTAYYLSGTYTSGAIDPGFEPPTWGDLSYATSGTGVVTLKVRSSATSDFSGATDWASCSNISSGAALSTGGCVTNGQRYIQYQASLSTSNSAVTPSLDSVGIFYSQYPSSGSLISSAYDSGDPANVMGGLSWLEDASMPSGAGVTVSLRTASTSALLSSASWTDFATSTSGCSEVAGTVTCSASALPAGLKDASNDRWFQYKVSLTSTGSGTPTISQVGVIYVVNAPPQFNTDFPTTSAGGVSASQVATSSDSNWGKVVIQYSVRDPDTSTGSNTPGYVTPSFEYNTGGGWVSIPNTYLSTDATSTKAVDSTTYATYTAVWDAKTQAANVFSSSTRIRVIINDNEAANNTATATSGYFTLDTKAPAVGTFTYDGTTGNVTFTATDDGNIQYRFSNSTPTPSSTAWISATSTVSVASAWTPTVANGFATVYADVIDSYGNTGTGILVLPDAPQNFDLRDTSNINTSDWREFLSWKLFVATSSSAFSKYEVYRSTDGVNYSLLGNVTNINTNYYTDTAVASSTRYYYKVAVVDTDGDRSAFSSSANDLVDGQGGTDFTPPSISAVASPDIQTSWAKITWTTDEISDSQVEWSVSPSLAYNFSASNTALVTDHSMIITGLQPNTNYLFRVKSKDIFNNTGTGDNGGSGYTLTTGGGPVISDVATQSVNDRSATIVWNTDRDANSYVVYSTNLANLRTGTNVTTAGSGSMVGGPPYQHLVTLPGLSGRTTYYFYVKSASSGNGFESIDNKNGDYYTFTTTYDTKTPTISDVSAPIRAQTSASIVWTTDELADGRVSYGSASGALTSQTSLDSTMSIYHLAAITGLTAETTYYYRVTSADASGNSTSSEEFSFATPKENTIINISSAGGAAPPQNLDKQAPTISGVSIGEIDAFSAVVKFDVNEAASGLVQFGETPAYGRSEGSFDQKTSHTIKLQRLKPGTDYHFRVQAMDKSGNISVSKDDVFTTKFAAEALDGITKLENAEDFQSQLENLIESTLPSLVPPVISEISINEITDTSAIVTWETNIKTYGSVGFEKDADFKSDAPAYRSEMSDTADRAKAHKVILSNLSPGTKYHFMIKSFALPGVNGKSKDRTFTTVASKIQPSLTRVANSSFTVTWTTPTETDSHVEYRDAKTGKVAQVGDDGKSTAHSVEVENLAPASTYNVRVFGYDNNGVIIEGTPIRVTTKQDNTPPDLTSIQISNAFVPYRPNQLQTIVSWKTSEPASSLVEFEEGVGVGETLSGSAGNKEELTTQHTVILSSFKPGTVYRVRITSVDEAGNKNATPIRTIITPAASESVFEVILKNFEDSFGFLKNINK